MQQLESGKRHVKVSNTPGAINSLPYRGKVKRVENMQLEGKREIDGDTPAVDEKEKLEVGK